MKLELEKLRSQADAATALLGAMANQNRLMILCHLLERELHGTEIGELIALEQSPLSQHLAKLRKLELVSTRRNGQSIYYRLASKEVEAVITTLHELYCT